MITEIPIDQDKSQAVEAKLREKLNNTNTDKGRKKRSIPFEGNGLSIVRKVCPSNYKIKIFLVLDYICMCVYQVLFAKSSFSVWSTTMTNGILACVVLRVYQPEVERRLNSDVIAAFQDLLELGW